MLKGNRGGMDLRAREDSRRWRNLGKGSYGQDVLYEKNKNKLRFKNEKHKASSAYPSLPLRNRGTSVLRHSPRERIKDPKTGTSVQFYYILSITTRARNPLGFMGESDRA